MILFLERSLMWTQFVIFNDMLSPTGANNNPFQADQERCRQFLAVLNDCKMDARQLANYKKVLERFVENLTISHVQESPIPRHVVDILGKTTTLPFGSRVYLHNIMKNRSLLENSKYGIPEFSKFCSKRDIDPILASPKQVKDFLVESFALKSKPSYILQYENFYTENIRKICEDLDFVSKFRHISGIKFVQTPDIRKLLEQAALLNAGEAAVGDLEVPGHWYSRYCSEPHSKPFWQHGLMRRMAADVMSGHLTVEQVARELAIPPVMVECGLARQQPDPEPSLTLADYVQRGYGDKTTFFAEASTLDFLENVRNRKVEVGEAAWMIGISKSQLLIEVGEIKTEEEMRQEKNEIIHEKRNQQENQKKTSPLEVQISQMEKMKDDLSPYEKVRLSNLKERQALMDELNFNEDKAELKKLSLGQKKNQPVEWSMVQERRVVGSKEC